MFPPSVLFSWSSTAAAPAGVRSDFLQGMRKNPQRARAVTRHAKQSGGRKGFTLIELLATLAITAILAVLLTSALRGALSQADSAKSMGNLRTLHAGMASYGADYGFWPSLNREDPFNPLQYGDQAWYYSLLVQRYIPVKRIKRGGFDCLFSDALISPSNKANQGSRWPWTSAPFPWTSSYAINTYWGDNYGKKPHNLIEGTIDRVRFSGGVNNSSAILLIECLHTWSGLYPWDHANWSKPGCAIPRKEKGKGALALLANGSVTSITPESHPDLPARKYWDPRFTAP